MLDVGYLSVLEATTCEQLEAELVRFTKRLGFETAALMAVADLTPTTSLFSDVGLVPAAYRSSYDDKSKGRIDPVMQHCRTKSIPLIWNQATYTQANQGEKWEHQAQFGYRCGISFAMHMPKGRHFVCGVDRDKPLPACLEEVSRMTADLQLFAVHAQEAAMRLLLPGAVEEHHPPALTQRELECLRWTLEGKTAWELGRILGIAEQTAARHINNASQKLACVNKYQAALKALRLNLIW